MNSAVRATVRVGLYTGAKVYFVHEVKVPHTQVPVQWHDIANHLGILSNLRFIDNVKLLIESGFSH